MLIFLKGTLSFKDRSLNIDKWNDTLSAMGFKMIQYGEEGGGIETRLS